jgi:hypothetical protein
MKRRLRILLTLASVWALVMALNVGAASAGEHENGVWEDCTNRADCAEVAPHWAPVGQNLLDPDFAGRHGLPGGPYDGPEQGQAADNIGRNPNCPLYWPLPPPPPE